MPLSGRLERRIRHDFPDPGSALEILRMLEELPDAAGYDAKHFGSERVQAAIVLLARGEAQKFHEAVRLAKTDWRDLLVAADLAHANWPDRLDTELGS
ncbi:hypothetical protein ACH4SP_22255 [Streptomyces sp. NPDC021093]|uniref:hypothetical protein n=1 Tax=Streptomyces sp. NPDC021093 TaxID=3365112 RepID=UPI0037AEED43